MWDGCIQGSSVHGGQAARGQTPGSWARRQGPRLRFLLVGSQELVINTQEAAPSLVAWHRGKGVENDDAKWRK